MVVTGGTIRDDMVNLGGYLTRGQDKVEQEGHTVGEGSRDIGGRRAIGWRCGDGDWRHPGGRRTPCGKSVRNERLGLEAGE